MKSRKIIAIFTSIILSSSVMVGCSNNKKSSSDNSSEKVYKIGMVTDTGGINDESFNQSAWEGLQKFKKDYGDKVDVT